MIQIFGWATFVTVLLMHYLLSIKHRYAFRFVLFVCVVCVGYGLVLGIDGIAFTLLNAIIFVIYLYRILKHRKTKHKKDLRETKLDYETYKKSKSSNIFF